MAASYQARCSSPKGFLASLLIIALVLPGCATRNLPPMGFGGKPFKPEADEQQIWSQADREEEKIRTGAKVYDDPLLEDYLARIGDRLVPPDIRTAGGPGFEFHMLRDPTLNAFAMPNGKVYVHTGLLARLDNEAQLATILGHEMTHVTHRHALRFERDARNKMILLNGVAVVASVGVAAAAGSRAQSGDHVGTAVLSRTAQAVLGLGLQLAALAAINGYGRDLESEADAGGLDMLVRAGYDPTEAPRVFELLRKESNDRGAIETFFFGNHPRLDERFQSTQGLLATTYAGVTGERDSEDFALRMRTVVRENAQLDVRAGRFKLAQEQLDRVLVITPKDPIAHLYYGDLHRLQAQRARSVAEKESLARLALDRYARAAELDPASPDPFRQIGFLYYQQKDVPHAREAFRKYLALKPDAPDAKRIKEYLVELDR